MHPFGRPLYSDPVYLDPEERQQEREKQIAWKAGYESRQASIDLAMQGQHGAYCAGFGHGVLWALLVAVSLVALAAWLL